MRTVKMVLAVFASLGLAAAAAGFVEGPLRAPRWLSCATSFAVLMAIAAIWIRMRRYRLDRHLHALPLAELRDRAFAVPVEYFRYIGEDHPSVVRYRSLCESRDVVALAREWPSLERDFVSLEVQAGRTGRPYVMDYFYDKERALRVLVSRTSAT